MRRLDHCPKNRPTAEKRVDATRPALVLLAAAALALTGCAPTPLPAYDTVRSQAQAAMQRVVDELPTGLRVDKNPSDKPFGCEGEGVFYTGQWTVFPPKGFDGQSFINGLPTALGSDFRTDDRGLELNYPAASFIRHRLHQQHRRRLRPHARRGSRRRHSLDFAVRPAARDRSAVIAAFSEMSRWP